MLSARPPSGSLMAANGVSASSRPSATTNNNSRSATTQRSYESSPQQSLNVSGNPDGGRAPLNNGDHSGRRRSSDTNTNANSSYRSTYSNNSYSNADGGGGQTNNNRMSQLAQADARPSAQAHYDRLVKELAGGANPTDNDVALSPARSPSSPQNNNFASGGQRLNDTTNSAEGQRMFSLTLSSVHSVPRPPPPAHLNKLADAHTALSPRRYGNAAERVEAYSRGTVPYADHVYELKDKHLYDYSSAMQVYNETLQTHVRHRLEALAADSEAFNDELRASNGFLPLPPIKQPFARGYDVEESAATGGGLRQGQLQISDVSTESRQLVLRDDGDAYHNERAGDHGRYNLPSPRQRVLSREVQQRLTSPRADAYRPKASRPNPKESDDLAAGTCGKKQQTDNSPKRETQAHFNMFKNMPREVDLLSPRARDAVARRSLGIVTVTDTSNNRVLTTVDFSPSYSSSVKKSELVTRLPHHTLALNYGTKKPPSPRGKNSRRIGRNSSPATSPYNYPSTTELFKANADAMSGKRPSISPAKLAYLESLSTTQTIKERLKRLMEEETLRNQRKHDKWEKDSVRVDDLRNRRRNPRREEAIDRITGRRPLSNTRVSQAPPSPVSSSSSRPTTAGASPSASYSMSFSQNAGSMSYASMSQSSGQQVQIPRPPPREEERSRKVDDEYAEEEQKNNVEEISDTHRRSRSDEPSEDEQRQNHAEKDSDDNDHSADQATEPPAGPADHSSSDDDGEEAVGVDGLLASV